MGKTSGCVGTQVRVTLKKKNRTELSQRHLPSGSCRRRTNTLAREQTWRAGVAQDGRNRIVNRIMNTLQRHTPLSGQDGLTELWKIANRFEENTFYAASDEHDYLKRITLKLLNLEITTQNEPNNALPTSSCGTNSVRPLDSGDSLQQVGQSGGIDQTDSVRSKMQTLKDKYLQDMRDLYNVLTNRSQQHMPEAQLQKQTHYKNVLHRMMSYLLASKGSLPKELKQDKVEAFEKQIVRTVETFKRRKQVAPQQLQPQH